MASLGTWIGKRKLKFPIREDVSLTQNTGVRPLADTLIRQKIED